MTNAVGPMKKRRGRNAGTKVVHILRDVFFFRSSLFVFLPYISLSSPILFPSHVCHARCPLILPRDSTGGALPSRLRLSHTSCCAHVIVRTWVYFIGGACRKYSDPSSVSRSIHMHSYVIFEPSRSLREHFFYFFDRGLSVIT